MTARRPHKGRDSGGGAHPAIHHGHHTMTHHRPKREADRPPTKENKLPHNLEAELATLGSILIDPKVLQDVRQIMAACDFYNESCSTLFSRLISMRDEDKPIDDMLILTEELMLADEFDRIGGSLFLSEVLHSTPVAAHACYYAEIVRDKSWLRRSIRALETLLAKAYDGRHEYKEIKQMSLGLLKKMGGVCDG